MSIIPLIVIGNVLDVENGRISCIFNGTIMLKQVGI